MAANQEQNFVFGNERERSLQGNPASWKFAKSGKIEKVFYVVNPKSHLFSFSIFPLLVNFQEAGLPRSDLSRSLPEILLLVCCHWQSAQEFRVY